MVLKLGMIYTVIDFEIYITICIEEYLFATPFIAPNK